MRRITSRLGVLVAAAVLVVTGASAAQAAGHPAQTSRATGETAYFNLHDNTGSDFVIELTDPDKIGEAREIISTGQHKIVVGTIVKEKADYNPQWNFHYDPATVNFVDGAIEVCDATIPFVEENLDEAGASFLPGLTWCPWMGVLTNEVTL